ncbi:hypothetical protein EDB87DRAFT_1577803 [Lactarius vividus]|nr:hypothetical protein EDB87DRAFT_1577803 [Lactarius vividus]
MALSANLRSPPAEPAGPQLVCHAIDTAAYYAAITPAHSAPALHGAATVSPLQLCHTRTLDLASDFGSLSVTAYSPLHLAFGAFVQSLIPDTVLILYGRHDSCEYVGPTAYEYGRSLLATYAKSLIRGSLFSTTNELKLGLHGPWPTEPSDRVQYLYFDHSARRAHRVQGGLATPLAPRWNETKVKHAWNTIPDNWVGLGHPSADTTIDLHLSLKSHDENENALIDALYEVSDPNHPRKSRSAGHPKRRHRARMKNLGVPDGVATNTGSSEGSSKVGIAQAYIEFCSRMWFARWVWNLVWFEKSRRWGCGTGEMRRLDIRNSCTEKRKLDDWSLRTVHGDNSDQARTCGKYSISWRQEVMGIGVSPVSKSIARNSASSSTRRGLDATVMH